MFQTSPLSRFSYPRRHFARLLSVGFTALGLMVLGACSDTPPPESEETAGQTYSTRGVVRQLAAPPGQELYIHHEEIPTFVDMDGEMVGMGSMAMPFPVSEAPIPEDLAVGDKVAFDFEVRWQGSPPMRLLKLTKLPGDTVLSFENAEASTESPAEGHEGHGDHEGHRDPSEDAAPSDSDEGEHQH